MADAYSRPDYWTDMLPQSWQHSINTNPILNALGRALNRRPADIEGASKRIFAQPGDREMDDRAWLLQQAQPQRRLNPLAAEMLDKGGLLANFLGPSVKLPGVPRAPGRYAMEYPGGRIDYKDMDGGVHVSGIYTNPEARGQGNAKQALQELIAAADAAKRPMSLEISPGAPGVDPARLRQWYESLGFSGPDYAMTRQPPPAGIRAYHGSPHDFDKFDMSKIGTGEGAQAYGRGLYFAEKEDVAQSYRNNLSRFREMQWDGAPISDTPRNYNAFRDSMETPEKWRVGKIVDYISARGGSHDDVLREARHYFDDRKPEWKAAFDEVASRLKTSWKPGRMYEVNIKADPDQFLDWDLPLSQQPEGVKKAYAEALKTVGHPDPTKVEQSAFGSSGQGLENLIGAWVKHDRAKTSDILRDAGIPGIKYLDQGSRAAGQGSRNFVVFDDALVTILRKYGLLPPAAVAAAGATNGGLDDGLAP